MGLYKTHAALGLLSNSPMLGPDGMEYVSAGDERIEE